MPGFVRDLEVSGQMGTSASGPSVHSAQHHYVDRLHITQRAWSDFLVPAGILMPSTLRSGIKLCCEQPAEQQLGEARWLDPGDIADGAGGMVCDSASAQSPPPSLKIDHGAALEGPGVAPQASA